MPKKPAPAMPGQYKEIERYQHKDKTRVNNPQAGLVRSGNDPDGSKASYSYDPHLDPTLVWAGKKEREEFDVDTVSIHVHERIDPKSIIYSAHYQNPNVASYNYQPSLFEPVFDHRAVRQEVQFYQHKNAWANRLIAGDSLLVMNSLLEKEGMAGQIQMVYMDPPYGIKYGSNFQPFVNKRDVKDGSDADLNVEPEMIKAFRDTWELGLHSYLSYLRDRLNLAHQLLHESGSIFVQISDENAHHVRELMDEVFGAENFLAQIVFLKTSGLSGNFLASRYDFLLWYGKKKSVTKYHQLYTPKGKADSTAQTYTWLELPDGTRRSMTSSEKDDPSTIPVGARVYKPGDMTSQGNPLIEFEYRGKTYRQAWKTNRQGLESLANNNRFHVAANSLQYVRYFDDFPYVPVTQLWSDTQTGSFTEQKIYVVQTGTKTIQRCLLMTTDPGDLVLDPTCGSGATAVVAEQWGRRWITCDTSRIALSLTRQRLMTSSFDWFSLAHENEGVGGGFRYKMVPHITLKSIATGSQPESEAMLDQPEIDAGIVRVTGPFTVEAVPAPTVRALDDIPGPSTIDNSISREGESSRQDSWRDALLKSGIRAKSGDKIEFSRIELLSSTRHLHAEAETLDGKRVLLSFGPEHAPLEQRQVELALEEAENLHPKPNIVLFVAFQFDPEAAKDIDEMQWPSVDVLRVVMNPDLLVSDLKKNQSGADTFWLVGSPDVEITKTKDDKFVVNVNGFDYYNPKTGEVEGGSSKEIAMWMLDTDYDGRSIFPTQVFFPMAGEKDGWSKIAKNLKVELNVDVLEKFEGTESIPFKAGENKRVGVKIIDNRGIESFCIKYLD